MRWRSRLSRIFWRTSSSSGTSRSGDVGGLEVLALSMRDVVDERAEGGLARDGADFPALGGGCSANAGDPAVAIDLVPTSTLEIYRQRRAAGAPYGKRLRQNAGHVDVGGSFTSSARRETPRRRSSCGRRLRQLFPEDRFRSWRVPRALRQSGAHHRYPPVLPPPIPLSFCRP